MQCHSCGTDVRDGQKFCMECGASLRGVADITGEVPGRHRRRDRPPRTSPTRADRSPQRHRRHHPGARRPVRRRTTSRMPILTGAVVGTVGTAPASRR